MPSYVNIGNDIRIADAGHGYFITDKHITIKEDQRDKFEFKPTNLRAVDQSPLPGTLLAKGSKVTVYFEDMDGFSPGIFDGSHSGYTGIMAKDVVSKVNADDDVKKIVKAGKDYEDLDKEEKQIMDAFFIEELKLEIDQTDKTKNSEAAYDALVASYSVIKRVLA